jgi:hypothetical protein
LKELKLKLLLRQITHWDFKNESIHRIPSTDVPIENNNNNNNNNNLNEIVVTPPTDNNTTPPSTCWKKMVVCCKSKETREVVRRGLEYVLSNDILKFNFRFFYCLRRWGVCLFFKGGYLFASGGQKMIKLINVNRNKKSKPIKIIVDKIKCQNRVKVNMSKVKVMYKRKVKK